MDKSIENKYKKLLELAKRITFPNGGRDYTNAKEEMAKLVCKEINK